MGDLVSDPLPEIVSDMAFDMALADVIAGHALSTPHKTAMHFEGEDTTYAQLWQHVEAATALLAGQGVKDGDRVAWLGLNEPSQLILLFALARLRAILLPLNYRLARAELAAILSHAGVSIIVVDDGHKAVADSLDSVHNDANAGGTIPKAQTRIIDAALLRASSIATTCVGQRWAGTGASAVLLVYTSGTTGKPKGALHTQAGLAANCVISADAHALTPNDHVLTALPLFHVGGLCIQTLPALYAGATVTLHARFDAGAWLSDVQDRRPSMSVLVPATLRAVIEHPLFVHADLSSLRLLNAGSSNIPASQIAAFHARGVPVCQVYGATETGPVSIYLKREDAMQRAGSAGRAGLGVSVRLVKVDADTSDEDAAPGAVGELWIRAPNVMCQYWNDLTNPGFQCGWFRTGDLARRDEDGFYWVVGRSKDMIISGGENIYPAELENILADCPLILEAAIIGQADERWGEVAVAVVVKAPNVGLDAAEVMKLFDGKLARFKQPRRVLFMESLPKTALGKVLKMELAQLAELSKFT